MRILWVTNIIFPVPAEAIGAPPPTTGGWMLSMADALARDGHQLAVASLYDGDSVRIFYEGGIEYYLLPGLGRRTRYDARLRHCWNQVVGGFKPDVIHIHGTEYAHALPLLEGWGGIPAVVSIQGLIGRYAKEYFGGLTLAEVLRQRTLRDIVRRAGISQGRRQFLRQAAVEERILKSVGHVIGRTTWDRANTLAVNPALVYHVCNETLREPFFHAGWTPGGCRRHSMFMSQATYPIKGLHLALRAMRLLKADFPDVTLAVAGRDITAAATWRARLRRTGYGAYISRLVKQYGLTGSVAFTGALGAEAMAERMAKAHAFVLASSIENSPNSLGEAQLVGTPCVASYVGGVPDMVTDGVDGLLYNYLEPAILANRVRRVFADDALAERLSHAGRARARVRHDPRANLDALTGIYREIAAVGGRVSGKG